MCHCQWCCGASAHPGTWKLQGSFGSMELDHLQPWDSAWQLEPGSPQWHPMGSLGCTEWPWNTLSLLWQGHREPGCSVPGSGCIKILPSGTGVSHSSISHLGMVPDCPAARRQALGEHPACRHSLEMGCCRSVAAPRCAPAFGFQEKF